MFTTGADAGSIALWAEAQPVLMIRNGAGDGTTIVRVAARRARRQRAEDPVLEIPHGALALSRHDCEVSRAGEIAPGLWTVAAVPDEAEIRLAPIDGVGDRQWSVGCGAWRMHWSEAIAIEGEAIFERQWLGGPWPGRTDSIMWMRAWDADEARGTLGEIEIRGPGGPWKADGSTQHRVDIMHTGAPTPPRRWYHAEIEGENDRYGSGRRSGYVEARTRAEAIEELREDWGPEMTAQWRGRARPIEANGRATRHR